MALAIETTCAIPSLDAVFDSLDDDKHMLKPADRSPLVERRHSIGQTSHKMLRSDDPEYFKKLRQIFAATHDPIVPPRNDQENSAPDLDADLDDTLANQTLDELFDDSPTKTMQKKAKRYSLGSSGAQAHLSYDLHATHQLDLHQMLFHKRQQKTDADAEVAAPSGKPASKSAGASSAALWLRLLSKRSRSSSRDTVVGATPRPSTDRPPAGWTPTVSVINAVLKLRKLRATRAAAAAKAATEAAEASQDVAARRRSDELEDAAEEAAAAACPDPQQFRDLDVQAFIEECWIAQAASDPGRASCLDGAYSEPAAGAFAPPMITLLPPGFVMAPPPAFAQAPSYASMPSFGSMPSYGSMPSCGSAPSYGASYLAPMAAPPMAAPPMRAAARAPMPVRESYESDGSVSHMAPPPLPQDAPAPQAMPPWIGQQASVHSSWAAVEPFYPPSHSAPAPVAPPVAPPRQVRPSSVSLLSMAQEKDGSLALQQRLMRMAPAEQRAAIDELAPHLSSLATHPFGNYLVSSMASLPAAHGALFGAVHGRVTTLMQHPQGSRVVQAVLGAMPAAQAEPLVNELVGRVAEVACGTHGSWSVVAAYKVAHAPFIVSEVAQQVAKLATSQNGSRVVQRVMSEAAANGADVSQIIEALAATDASTLASLAADRFGNYVVQLALRGASAEARARLIDSLLPAAFTSELSQSKCGSNVAEMLVELASAEQLQRVRAALPEQAAAALRVHQYGKYVMTALDRRA